MSLIPECRDAITFVKDLVTSIRESPKRIASFAGFQDFDAKALRPLCPTRWTMRICSIQSILTNWEALSNFVENQVATRNEYEAKCSGYLLQLRGFRMYFTLRCLEFVFQKLEMTACAIQSPKLCMSDITELIEILLCSLKEKRTDESFNKFWIDVTHDATTLDIDEPIVPRVRRRPARFVEGSADAHVFSDAKSLHRKLYFKIIDAANSLEERFHSPSFNKIKELELNIVRASTVHNCDVSSITGIYKELSDPRLYLHFEMFRDICRQRQITIRTVSDIADFLRENTT